MTDPFIRRRSHPIGLAIAANLGRISRAGHAVGVGVADLGGSAVVIGGGPSCHGFDRIEPGTLTWCVNTSSPKVCAEFAPDVLVVREVVGVGDQVSRLRHKPKLAVLDIGTATSTVDALEAEGIPIAWVVPAQSILVWLAEALGTRPVYGGESAMTMAVALTDRIGCRRVSLMGCNLAFGADGTAYGDGTAWSGARVEVRGSVVDFGDRRGMQEHSRASGVQAPPLREDFTPVLMEDGTEGKALATWVSQRTWCEQWARRHPRTEFRNLSGGAKVDGWEPATRTPSTQHGLPYAPAVPVVPMDVSGIETEVRRQIRLCRDALDSKTPWTLDTVRGYPLIDYAAAAGIAEISDRSLPLRVALADRRPVMRHAVDAVERAFEGSCGAS